MTLINSLSHLELGDEKVTLNHVDVMIFPFSIQFMFSNQGTPGPEIENRLFG